jgi:hypothetical protein
MEAVKRIGGPGEVVRDLGMHLVISTLGGVAAGGAEEPCTMCACMQVLSRYMHWCWHCLQATNAGSAAH